MMGYFNTYLTLIGIGLIANAFYHRSIPAACLFVAYGVLLMICDMIAHRQLGLAAKAAITKSIGARPELFEELESIPVFAYWTKDHRSASRALIIHSFAFEIGNNQAHLSGSEIGKDICKVLAKELRIEESQLHPISTKDREILVAMPTRGLFGMFPLTRVAIWDDFYVDEPSFHETTEARRAING